MSEKWVNLGTLIIALIALVQPWLIYLWNKFLKPPKLDFYETGKIEIGFSQYYTTIGLRGTLRALTRDLYIKKNNLELIRKKDLSQHLLEWGFFRDSKIDINEPENLKIELPGGFLLSKEAPKRLNIQFHDLNQQEEISPLLIQLQDIWLDYQEKQYPIGERQADTNEEFQIKNQVTFDEFSQKSKVSNIYSEIDRNFYLKAGGYTLKMNVYTSKPNDKFSFSWDFNLSTRQCEHLRLNVVKLIDYSCNQFRDEWNFAYAVFE
jgi:hypothetical protein